MAQGKTLPGTLAMNPADLLGSTRLFAGLARELTEQLALMARVEEYPAGHQIFAQGEDGDVMYVILHGLVKVFVTSEEGDEMVLVDLRACESFGELALLDGQPRSASVATLEDCTVMALSRSDLLAAMRANPALMEALVRNLGAVVRRLTEQTSDLVFLDLHERVIKLLLGLMNDFGVANPEGGMRLDLGLTLEDLAGVVGGSHENVHEILLSFAQLSYLEIVDRHIVVRNPAHLAEAVTSGLSWSTLAQQAFHDPLTHLSNRTHFDERVSAAISLSRAADQPMAVLIVDIDDFKSVNDSLGHQAGDELLSITADRLRQCIRRPDTAARLGGDEFGLVITEFRTDDIPLKVAARVVEALHQTTRLNGVSVETTASVGVAILRPGVDSKPAALVDAADAAMYQAKKGGKARFAVAQPPYAPEPGETPGA